MHASQPTAQTRLVVLAGAAVILGCFLVIRARALGSTKDTGQRAVTQLETMRVDAAEILRLREAPRTAAARSRTSQELLAQVEKAVDAAGIPRESWRDSVPQATIRIPDSDYKRESTRLFLESVSLRQLAAFACALQVEDPTLSVSALSIVNRDPASEAFDVEVAVSYLVYAPTRVTRQKTSP